MEDVTSWSAGNGDTYKAPLKVSQAGQVQSEYDLCIFQPKEHTHNASVFAALPGCHIQTEVSCRHITIGRQKTKAWAAITTIKATALPEVLQQATLNSSALGNMMVISGYTGDPSSNLDKSLAVQMLRSSSQLNLDRWQAQYVGERKTYAVLVVDIVSTVYQKSRHVSMLGEYTQPATHKSPPHHIQLSNAALRHCLSHPVAETQARQTSAALSMHRYTPDSQSSPDAGCEVQNGVADIKVQAEGFTKDPALKVSARLTVRHLEGRETLQKHSVGSIALKTFCGSLFHAWAANERRAHPELPQETVEAAVLTSLEFQVPQDPPRHTCMPTSHLNRLNLPFNERWYSFWHTVFLNSLTPLSGVKCKHRCRHAPPMKARLQYAPQPEFCVLITALLKPTSPPSQLLEFFSTGSQEKGRESPYLECVMTSAEAVAALKEAGNITLESPTAVLRIDVEKECIPALALEMPITSALWRALQRADIRRELVRRLTEAPQAVWHMARKFLPDDTLSAGSQPAYYNSLRKPTTEVTVDNVIGFLFDWYADPQLRPMYAVSHVKTTDVFNKCRNVTGLSGF